MYKHNKIRLISDDCNKIIEKSTYYFSDCGNLLFIKSSEVEHTYYCIPVFNIKIIEFNNSNEIIIRLKGNLYRKDD